MSDLNHKQIANLVTLFIQKGDSNAFAQIYALTYDKTYNYAFHYLHDSYLAQDALQEIYIQAMKHISTLKDPELFVAWLNRISFTVCYDMTQKLGQSPPASSELLEFVEIPDNHDTPEKAYEKKDEKNSLQVALERLPFLEKQIIILRFYRDMKLEDIAKTLSVSRSTIKRQLISAQNHLRNYILESEVC